MSKAGLSKVMAEIALICVHSLKSAMLGGNDAFLPVFGGVFMDKAR